MTRHKESYSWVYIGLAILIGGAILYFLFFSSSSGYVKIKYRDDKVNISSSSSGIVHPATLSPGEGRLLAGNSLSHHTQTRHYPYT